jgi:ABC-2 type transport system permease protein
MITLYKKEISIFFSTIIGYLIIGLFLLISSLILWHDISEINILDNAYASLDYFFSTAPLIFLLFIPSVSMRVFSEEFKTGTIEILITKPISSFEIVTAKFFAVLSLVIIAILPTITYVISIYFLGETTGNLDLAAVVGSYIGLLLLSSIFASISVYASSLSSNQIVSFIIAIIMSSFFFFGFDILSHLPYLQIVDLTLQKIGISYHYNIMSKGLLKVSDLVYFISVSLLFIKLTEIVIKIKKT